MKILPLMLLSATCVLTACSSGGSNDNASGVNALLSQATTSTTSTTSATANTTASTTSSDTTDSTSTSNTTTTNSSSATDSTATTDNSSTTDSSATTDNSSTTDSTATTDNSSTTDSTATTDSSSATDSTATTDNSSATDSTATTDSSSTTDSTATTDNSSATDSTATTDSTSTSLTASDVNDALQATFNTSSDHLTGTTVTFTNTTVTATDPTSSSLDSLVLDGKTLTLYTDEDKQNVDNSRTMTTKTDNGTTTFGSYAAYTAGTGKITQHADFKNMRYGVHTTEAGVSTLFVQGNISTSMPSRYIYTYTGNALYGKDSDYGQLTSKAVANFNTKTIKVELTESGSDTAKLTFGGTINTDTARFSGKDSEGIVTEGAFYGPYRDVGGIFYQTEGTEAGYNGVFGATGRVQTKDESDTTTATDY